jgi:hypothetical protein
MLGMCKQGKRDVSEIEFFATISLEIRNLLIVLHSFNIVATWDVFLTFNFFTEFLIMNLLTRKPLIAAIAAAVGMITPWSNVFATPEQPIGPNASGTYIPVYVPAESKESSQELKNALDKDFDTDTSTLGALGHLGVFIKTYPGYPVSANKTLTVKLTLTGGATFKDKAVLICAHSGASTPYVAAQISGILFKDAHSSFAVSPATPTNDVNSAYLIPPNSDSTNKNSVSFNFPQGFNIPVNSGLCLLTYNSVLTRAAGLSTPAAATGYDVVILGKGEDISIQSEVTYQDLFGSVTTTATIPMVKVVNAFKTEAIKTTTAATPVVGYAMVDVKQNSTQFLKKDNTNSTNAFLGQVRVVYTDSTITKLRSVAGKVITAADIFTSARITISGPTIAGVGSVTFEKSDGAACVGGSTYLAKATPAAVANTPDGTGGSVTDASISFDYGEAFSAIFGAISPPSSVAVKTGFNVCLNAATGKSMAEGNVTINVVGLKGTVESDLGSGELTTVTKNGTTLRVLNIPGSTNAERAFIRLYNTGNQSFKVTGTLYSDKGEKLNSGETMDLLGKDLQPGDVKAIDALTLEKLSGKTWTGRAWLLIQAPISSDFFKVQALIRTPNTSGYLTNSSTDAMD